MTSISTLFACLLAIPLSLADDDSDAVKEKRSKAAELRARIASDQQEFLKLKNGPCRCGAASHAECKTKDVCEPSEESRMKEYREDALSASRDLAPIATF